MVVVNRFVVDVIVLLVKQVRLWREPDGEVLNKS
jgi:hypothetical protein